jgi:prepilin-type N-terminal cleavage/methylation domain-containing protein
MALLLSGPVMFDLIRSFARQRQMTSGSDSGFTLPEMLITIGIIGTISAISVAVMSSMMTSSRADSSTVAALNVMRLARDRAIAERRNMQVNFVTPNRIQIIRQEVPTGTTVLSTTHLENGQEFRQFTGLPDTPDAFGNSGPIAFGSTPLILFSTEGTLVDNVGQVLNGTLFLGINGQKTSARAITVFGPTAMLKIWKWDGSKWAEG